MMNRGNVWLAVSGIVDYDGKWLVVKKSYSGLKGQWSFPAGFVEANETIDEAIVREVHEETGIDTKVKDIVGIRSGVIKEKISDNMILFSLKAEHDDIVIDEKELESAAFISPKQLLNDQDSSLLVKEYAKSNMLNQMFQTYNLNPGLQFGYTKYKLFKNK
jgi:8-oxo-dGTP diphosphatase